MSEDSGRRISDPVDRPVATARPAYNRVAPVYDLAENPFECRARKHTREMLAARPGERALEIGPGTGRALVVLASRTGPEEPWALTEGRVIRKGKVMKR